MLNDTPADRVDDGSWMQLSDKLKLALGIFWGLFTVYIIISLIPPVDRRLQAWEARFKNFKRRPAAPNRAQKIVFILLASLMVGELCANSFHHHLADIIGISSEKLLLLMMILPVLYFALAWLKMDHDHDGNPGRIDSSDKSSK